MYRTNGQRVFGNEQIHPLIKPGLIGHWVGGGSGLTWFDRSGKGGHGVLTNGPLWILGEGNKRDAIIFDGVNDYAGVGTLPQLVGATGLTASFWVKTSNTTTTNAVLGSYDGGSGASWSIDFNYGASLPDASKIRVLLRDASVNELSGYTTAVTTAMDNAWHHITVVWNLTAKTLAIYIDGNSKALTMVLSSIGATVTAFTYQTYLGALNNVNAVARPFPGILDNVCIHNRALSDAEITLLAAA